MLAAQGGPAGPFPAPPAPGRRAASGLVARLGLPLAHRHVREAVADHRADRDRILAAVELDLSNSKLEGLNSKIRLINHRGYGHHCAAALIAMIYLCCGGITVQVPTAGTHGKMRRIKIQPQVGLLKEP